MSDNSPPASKADPFNEVVIKDRRDTSTRFLVLFLTCLAGLGDAYVYDSPGALVTSLEHVLST